MGNSSQKLEIALKNIQDSINKGKDVFIKKCRKVQDKMNFDLSDDQVLLKMADAIRLMNEANKEYYAFLCIKLEEVDQTANNYSIDDLKYEDVEHVYRMIQFINDESTIENSFEGILNQGFSSTSFGTMAVVTYQPSVEAKKIELRWKEKLDKMPESKKKAYQEKQNSAKHTKEQYLAELEVWERECSSIKKNRDDFINLIVEKRVEELKEELTEKYSNDTAGIKDSIQALSEDLNRKTSELKKLGFFKNSEKKALKTAIVDLQKKINEMSSSMDNRKLQYDQELIEVRAKARKAVEKNAIAQIGRAHV